MSTKDEIEEEEGGYDEEEDAEMVTEGHHMTTTPDSKPIISGRSVTLQMLITDHIMEPGNAVLTLKYLGRKFIADLLPNGKIQTPATKEVFATPSAWAQHCKRQINPEKKSGCGWASIMYKGRKLDSWKTSWFRKYHPHSPARSRETPSPRSICSDLNGEPSDLRSRPPLELGSRPHSDLGSRSHSDVISRPPSELGSQTPWDLGSQPHSDLGSQPPSDAGSRPPSGLGSHHSEVDPQTDVEPSTDKLDEGWDRVSGPSEEAAPLDLTAKPAHTSTPVFNGGSQTQRSSVEKSNGNSHQEEALNLSLKTTPTNEKRRMKLLATPSATPPVTPPSTPASETNNNNVCDRVSIRHSALKKRSQNIDPNTLVECEAFSNLDKVQPFTVSMTTNASLLMIRKQMTRVGLSLVGWYHSHPYCQPDPSVKDIDCQMSYQLRMKGKGSTYFPCVGCIVAPYNRKTTKKTSSLQIFMVMPPLESQPSDYGIPMKVKYSLRQNQSVTEDLLTEMRVIADFYRGAPDFLKFRQIWQPSISYMDKIKCSLARRLPEDQMESGTFLDFVQHILTPK
ncbi:MPN domain-containing protein-like [Ylistrum balloti]|uniref:MPN domain-containing protein-like n=1 Tax=Ylistrum balloti TaxID=509963 RepID=UPI002905B97F|nr:MPN domain-containing protein-like [Ylistrum balloti]